MLDQILKRVVVDPEVDAAFAAIPNKVNELGYDARTTKQLAELN